MILCKQKTLTQKNSNLKCKRESHYCQAAKLGMDHKEYMQRMLNYYKIRSNSILYDKELLGYSMQSMKQEKDIEEDIILTESIKKKANNQGSTNMFDISNQICSTG